jgi:hypothetical protein
VQDVIGSCVQCRKSQVYKAERPPMLQVRCVAASMRTLEWARAHGVPWDEWLCAAAAAQGRLEVVKALHEQECG